MSFVSVESTRHCRSKLAPSQGYGRPIRGKLSSTIPFEERLPMDETAVATTTGVAQVFDLNALKAFASDKRVRKMLFKTDQLWSEIACYEPGQSTVMHHHAKEEEAIFVLQGTANMSVAGEEYRSEERRVGKGGREGARPGREKKKCG